LYFEALGKLSAGELACLFGQNGAIESDTQEANDNFDCISLNNVLFSHAESNWVLKIDSFQIKRNEIVGIIGKSGVGKSTFVQIILGDLLSTKGQISVNGRPISDWITSNPGAIAYVPQFPALISGTILDNIAFGVPKNNIDFERVSNSISKAQLGNFVANLSGGMYTQIKDVSENLSGGERQRLGIARALYSNPSVLILDEPTSSLDSDTSKRIQDSLELLKTDAAILIISHNEDLISRAEKVYEIFGDDRQSSLRQIRSSLP
jgi:ABC-type multidrug transport system fused ATPase/permease subunit